MSQEELADRSRLARPTISKIERGETIPSPLSKRKLADALSCRVEDIFPPDRDQKTAPTFVDRIFSPTGLAGICIINGLQLAPATRGGTAAAAPPSVDVAIEENRIVGFLIDVTGQRISGVRVELFQDGEKIDAAETNSSGRFMFDFLTPGDYQIRAEDKLLQVRISFQEGEDLDLDVD
jgi:transcriptional regulator with XRE-family HTH domain